MSSPLRVAVVGTGFGARVQVPGFRAVPDVEVVAIVSARAERAEATAQQLNIPAAYTDFARMLAEVKPDIVSIVTPPIDHAPMTLAAFEAGAHVICEKPFAMNAAEAQTMLEAAERLGRVHAIDHEFRYLPARHYQKALVDDGFIGEVRLLEATALMSVRADPTRAWNWWADETQGGGMLGAIGSHYIDTFRWLAGCEVEAVSAVLNTFIAERPSADGPRAVTADDSAAVILKMENGAQGVLHVSAVAPVAYQKLGVYGSRGFAVVEDDVRIHGGHLGEAARPLDIPAEHLLPGWNDRNILEAPFALMVRQVVRAIREGTQVTPNFVDGVRVQAVLDAARESALLQRWVRVAR